MNSITMPNPPLKLPSAPKRRRLHGFFAGTLIAVKDGWLPVEALSPGTEVWTFDDGLQPIMDIKTYTLPTASQGAHGAAKLMSVPAGTLANENDLLFLPEMGLLLECEQTQDSFGDPFAVIPALALEGVCGITPARALGARKLHHLCFAQEEVVYIDSGLLAHCPVLDAQETQTAARYDVKALEVAKNLLTDLDLAELALREADENFRVSFEVTEVAQEIGKQERETRGLSFSALRATTVDRFNSSVRRLLFANRNVRKSSGPFLPSRATGQGR